MDSILTSVKKMLGIAEEYAQFDADIIMHINSVFSVLSQLGVGPEDGFVIEDSSTTWTDFADGSELPGKIAMVKSYMYLKVRLLFDNSTLTSPVIESINRQIEELEWRLNVAVDPPKSSD